LVLFLCYAIWFLKWQSPVKYIKVIAVLILYYTAIRFFQNVDSRVRIIEVIHFLEYGVLSLLYFKAYKKWQDTSSLNLGNFIVPVIIMCVIGTLDETIQWMVERRTGEIRDIYVNIVAGALPQVLLLLFSPSGVKTLIRFHRRDLPFFLNGWIIFFLCISFFYYFVHMGNIIKSPNQWDFVSHFTKPQLRSFKDDPEFHSLIKLYLNSTNAWKLENYYISEAMGHEGARNKFYQKGHLDKAFYENEILENYYTSYLDSKNARWPVEQLKECQLAVEKIQRHYYKSGCWRNILLTGIDLRNYWLLVVMIIALLVIIKKSSRIPA